MPKKLFSPLTFIALFLAVTHIASRPLSAQTPEKPGKIAAQLQQFLDSNTLAGAVTLVASKDKILDLEAVGYADIAAKKPMRTDDLFWIASMSKGITAAGLMILVDEGKVNVDDPVFKYLPEFEGVMVQGEKTKDHVILKYPEHAITVKNVLSHTSGLPFASRVEHHIDEFPLRDAVFLDSMTPLKTQPGTNWDYSNAGINVAGRIIEKVSGMPYEEFMQKRLFDPLGMKDTTFFPTEAQLSRLAKSYRPNATKHGLEEMPISQLTYPLTAHNRYPSPSGGLFSTAADVGHFCQMVLAGGTFEGKRLISEISIQQMTSSQTGTLKDKEHGENGYGFGWGTHRKVTGPPQPGSGAAFGHGGAYSTDMEIDPEHNLIFVYMVQHAGYGTKDGGRINAVFQSTAAKEFGGK